MGDNAAIFWDFDATLGYRDGKWTATLHGILEKRGVHVDYHELRPFLSVGFPWDSPGVSLGEIAGNRSWWEYMNVYFAEIFRRMGLEEKSAEDAAREVRGEYLRRDRWFLFEDTIPVLTYFEKKGLPQYILSNHVPELPDLVRNLGIGPFFRDIICSALAGFEKPTREIYSYARERAGHPPLCIMIGDSYRADIAGAVRAGFQAVLVRSANTKEYPRYSPDLHGAVALVEKILGEK